MDFAFGTLSTDTLKLYHHQLRHQGLHHGHQISPRSPQANSPITLYATTGLDLDADFLACYYSTDASEPFGQRGQSEEAKVCLFEVVEQVWDSFIWGYVTRWQATLPGLPEGTLLRYRIGAWSQQGEEIFADYPDLKMSAENVASRHFQQNLPPDPTVRWGSTQPGTVFTLNIGQPAAPDWAKSAVLYHVMVDRFHPGEANDWRQRNDLYQSCGGTLHGVYDKLGYIADLGVNCLWLSPIWTSPSYHGYDTADYREVEPRFGNKKLLRRLIDKAHTLGLRILFDMACNHLSNLHPIFQAAQADSRSPYRHWFIFDESELGYRSFFGVKSMPELKLSQPDARDWMIENALYWLREFDIDGYRLDYANGARPDFWSFFVKACKSEKADCFCFGEIIDTPDKLQAYAGRLDGSLDFHLNYALRQTYAWQNWEEADFDRFLGRHQAYMPEEFISPAFLDNHDMDRFLFAAQGDRSILKTALTKLMQLPNPPVLLYGTEVGASQKLSSREAGLDIIREPMPWGNEQDADLLAFTRALIQTRNRQNLARRGS